MKLSDLKVFELAKGAKKDYNVIVMCILAYVLAMAGGLVGELLSIPFIGSMPAYLSTSVFQLIIGFGAMVALVMLFMEKREKRSFVQMGLFKENAGKFYLRGFLIGIGFMAIVVVAGMVTGAYQVTMNDISLSLLGPIVVMLLGFMVQGAAEEVLVRGWMIPMLAKRYNVAFAIVASSVFFALFHAMNPGMTVMPVINLILVGFFLALYYVKEQSLWGVFGFHSAWNWVQGNIFGIKVSGSNLPGGSIFQTASVEGKELISGGAFGAEGGILCSIILLVGIVYLFVKIKADYEFK